MREEARRWNEIGKKNWREGKIECERRENKIKKDTAVSALVIWENRGTTA